MASLARTYARREITKRQGAAVSLGRFFQAIEPAFIYSQWLRDLVSHLEWAMATPGARLLIFAPPRHGKSQVVSRTLPPFLLGRNPKDEVMCVSASQELSDEFGLYVRNQLNSPFYKDLFPDSAIDPNSNAVSRITLKEKGGYRAVGVGGQIVGRGADWLIIDDPYKDRNQAYNKAERAKLLNWYTTAARNRLSPTGRVIIMHQRFVVDDLAADVLTMAENDPNADQFRVLSYPAIAEEGDHLGRYPGEPLFPERWTLTHLKALRATMEEADWLAMYQQRPIAITGGYFRDTDFRWYIPSKLPKNLRWFLGFDLAVSTANTADKSAIVPVGVDENGDAYIAPDYAWGRIESIESVAKILAYYRQYHYQFAAGEKGVIARAIGPFLRKAMQESSTYITLEEVTRTDGKHVVATPLQARMRSGKVYFPDDRRTRGEVMPTFMNFQPAADNSDDDFIDGLANLFQILDRMIPSSPVEVAKEELSEEEAEAAMWEKIMKGGRAPTPAAPFARLNGDPITARKAKIA